MANCLPPVVVRIKESEGVGEGKDWLVPGEVSFRMVLVSGMDVFKPHTLSY